MVESDCIEVEQRKRRRMLAWQAGKISKDDNFLASIDVDFLAQRAALSVRPWSPLNASLPRLPEHCVGKPSARKHLW